METQIQSVEDSLIDGLSFRLPNSANFIQDRRSVTFFPSGGDGYTPRGVKMIKFHIAGTDWIDPSTVRVQFKLNNLSAQAPLTPLNPLPANFFRRLRIIAGGQVIEDIDYYNRIYNLVHTLLPSERRQNDYNEGFGMPLGPAAHESGLHVASLRPPEAIVANGNRVVMFPLMCGLFNQTKFLPIRYLQGLQIELEVVNQYEDACIFTTALGQQQLGAASSREWSITEPVIKCDVITLDNQLDNEYTDHLMQGKTLPINFSSFVHQVQAMHRTPEQIISMTRSFTRLKTVFLTFFKNNVVTNPLNNARDEAAIANHLPLRECNFFYHPQFFYPGNQNNSMFVPQNDNGYTTFLYQTEPELQLQVGSKLFPEIPSRSTAESYYQLGKR
jgi:hypothetical protein